MVLVFIKGNLFSLIPFRICFYEGSKEWFEAVKQAEPTSNSFDRMEGLAPLISKSAS